MSNDLKIKSVKVILDKPRNLIFDLNAFEVLEDMYGCADDAFKALEKDKGKIKHIKNFLYAGLVHEDDNLTPSIVGSWIGYSNISEMTDNIWTAISNTLPEPKEGTGGSESAEGEK